MAVSTTSHTTSWVLSRLLVLEVLRTPGMSSTSAAAAAASSSTKTSYQPLVISQ